MELFLNLVSEIPSEKTQDNLKGITNKISEILDGVKDKTKATQFLKESLIADKDISYFKNKNSLDFYNVWSDYLYWTYLTNWEVLKLNDCLVVGDSIYDAIAAKKAKMYFIGVTTGYSAKNQLKNITTWF